MRPGNAHSAADWRDVLGPVVARYRSRLKRALLASLEKTQSARAEVVEYNTSNAAINDPSAIAIGIGIKP